MKHLGTTTAVLAALLLSGCARQPTPREACLGDEFEPCSGGRCGNC